MEKTEIGVDVFKKVKFFPPVKFADTGASGENIDITVQSSSDLMEERKKFRSRVEVIGNILPETHEFTKLVKNVCERLGLQEGTEYIVIDTEDPECFFNPKTKTVGLSRGTCRYLIERNGLALSEDHIAALLAHEIAHSEVLGESYVKRLEESAIARILSQQNTAEEYRADARAMRLLSKAKYNPTALVQVLRSFPLEHGRYESAHPEQIERIRYLESRLADDENPLSFTTKELEAVDPDLLVWFTQDSEVYNTTETLLHSSSESLDELIKHSPDQKSFWRTLYAKLHVDRVASAKSLLSQEGSRLNNLALKLMVYEAFLGDHLVINGKAIRLNMTANNALIDVHGNITDEESHDIFSASRGITDHEGVETIIKSSEFRNAVPASSSAASDSETATKLASLEAALDKAITARFEALQSLPLSDEEKAYYEGLKSSLNSGTPTSDLFLTLFSSVDRDTQIGLQQASEEDALRKGNRAPEKYEEGLRDLKDQNVRDNLFAQIKLDLAMRLSGRQALSPDYISTLSLCIAKDTGLTPEGSQILANIMLFGQEEDQWINYLKTLSRDSLPQIMDSVKLVSQGYRLRTSPFRKFHSSYRSSSYSEGGFPSYAHARNLDIDHHGLEILQILPSTELYLRGVPEGQQSALVPGDTIYPTDLNLTVEEWDLIAESYYGYRESKEAWILHQYIDQIKTAGVVNNEISERAKTIKRWPNYGVKGGVRLTPKDVTLLIQHPVWSTYDLQLLVAGALENFPGAFENMRGLHRSEETQATKDQRLELLEVYPVIYKFFKENPVLEGEHETDWSPEEIASRMLDVQTQENESLGLSEKDSALKALKQLADQGISFSFSSLSEEVTKRIKQFTLEEVIEISDYFGRIQNPDQNQVEVSEIFKLLGVLWEDSRFRDENGNISLRLIPKEEHLSIITEKLKGETVNWILSNFSPSIKRDGLIASVIIASEGEERDRFIADAKGKFVYSSDKSGKHTALFPYEQYFFYQSEQEDLSSFRSPGRLGEHYDDLLLRRHPFATKTEIIEPIGEYRQFPSFYDLKRRFGSVQQGLEARLLIAQEDYIFNREIELGDRVARLVDTVPFACAVRDIHVEMLFQDEMLNAKSDQERIAIGNALLPLFTEKSSLKANFATELLRAQLRVDPSVLRDFDKSIALITYYLPGASLARNYFLTMLENSVPLTPDQMQVLTKMRISPEGKRDEQDLAPQTYIFDQLGELNRDERAKTVLWMLGISGEKPIKVRSIEEDLGGHLDSLPNTVMLSTDDEKEVLFRKLFLGAEGIVDLEAVSADKLNEAKEQRKRFIGELAKTLLPDTMPRAELFREIFSAVIESSDPPHASRILTKLINRFSQSKIEGKELPPEEVLALGLSELGVVGKKVSQSLAELEWVPASYKKTLRKSQSEGEVVPKRAIYVMAEDAGLLSESSPIRVVSFDDLIGAASNKQACMITIEVKDASVGLPIGRHQVVGKFKRPSAQKTENIDHDLRVLKNILDILQARGYAQALPTDFSAQISNAVRKELDFTREKQFNEEIKVDLEARNKKRRYKVGVPKIFFASDDVMLESKAPGISLRSYQNLREAGSDQLLASGYGALSERDINQTVVTEALSQLVATGNIHADLHPGNIFVDQNGNLTFIDLGMHERLNRGQRLNTISLIAGLATGNEQYVKKALQTFEWNLGDAKLDLRRFSFGYNTLQLLKASQKASTPPPELLGAVILSASKLSTYTSRFNNKELFNMLMGAVNKREIPQIVTHLVQSGGRHLLRENS